MADTDHRLGHLHKAIPRREALIILGGAAGAALWPVRAVAALKQASVGDARATSAAACVLTPEVTEGPYYIANHLLRRNITEGQAGLPLTLKLLIQNATTCKPIANANVEIWHANALGVYSGYGSGSSPGGGGGGGGGGGHATPTDKLTFLRGHQIADADGRVTFQTIYPGWYRGRAPHIHLKVHVGGSVVHTGQLFFADATSDAVYRTAHYKSHGQPDTTDASDSIYKQAGGSSALVKLAKASGGGFVGSMTLGVKA
jgi:protocatechuate 3,4-dioxygenase beta subunit